MSESTGQQTLREKRAQLPKKEGYGSLEKGEKEMGGGYDYRLLSFLNDAVKTVSQTQSLPIWEIMFAALVGLRKETLCWSQ